MHQNAEERLGLLHTITEIVNIEVEKRMGAFTDAEHFSVRDASMAKPTSGTLTSEQDKKKRYMNNLSPQSVRNKKAGYKSHFINTTKKLLLLCALLVSVITLSGAVNRSFHTTLEQWNPIGFTQATNGITQAQSGPQTTNRLTAGSAILPTVATAAPSGELRGGSDNVITFTTAKAVGETVKLKMEYTGDAPTLVGLTGTPVSGEEVTYALTAKNVTITGDVTYFDCSDNQLTALDVSNTALTDLNCSNNQLTALDVSKNSALTVLDCYKNQLTTLDVSQNTALTWLWCYNNQLTALDVSQNTALNWLECEENRLTGLEVSQNTALTTLSCSTNQLTALDVSQNTALTYLYCDENQLTALDVSKNTALSSLGCSYNQLTTLDVSKNTELETLNCHGNQIKGEEMTRLVNSLPDRTRKYAGTFTVVQEPALEGNICLKANIAIAKSKNWNTKKYKSDTKEYVAYEGAEEAQPLKVTLTKEGEGTIIATGADDLKAVPEGTEPTIVATPADGYELTALTANGTDILAAKKFVVTAASEVKATFTKKTYAVMLTMVGEGMIGATGASDFNAVPYGTELTIEATPADGYELKALTANGADILATKKVVVKGATEVKATFAKTYAVTLTKEGEGTLTATGAADLNAVPEGTELTIEAAPAAGYELKALTANGTDILATKKVVVKGATEVKATFAKKTAADVVESSSVRLYPNPASAYVNVKGAKADALVRLYDANGTLRYEARTDADGTLQIYLSAYAKGTYLLRVGNDAQRLLIQR